MVRGGSEGGEVEVWGRVLWDEFGGCLMGL